MAYKIDYSKVEIPEGLDPKKYNYIQRRAEILKLIIAEGHPRLISQTKLAKHYGVSQAQISMDIREIAKSFNAKRDATDIKFITELVYQKCIRKLLEREDYTQAANVLNAWTNWLFNVGDLKKTATELEVKKYITVEDIKKAFEEVKNENTK